MRHFALKFLMAAALAGGSAPALAGPVETRAFDTGVATAKAAMMSDPATALASAAVAQKAASAMSGSEGATARATAEWLSGEALTRLGKPKEALARFEEGARIIGNQRQPTKIQADLLKGQAGAWSKIGDVQRALPLLHRAYRLYRLLGDARSQAIVLYNIGSIHYDARDYPRMLQYLDQASQAYRQDQALSVALHNNRGNAMKELRRFEEAEKEYRKAMETSRAMGNVLLEANALSNLAASQLQNGNLAQASRTVTLALKISQGPAAEVRPFLLGTAAQIALRRGNLEQAERLIGQSLAGIDPATSTMPYRDNHEAAWKIYEKLGRHQLAVAHLAAFKRLDDSGRELAASTNNALMTAQFDSANQKLHISQLEAQKAQRELALARSENRLKGYTILFVIGALAAIAVILALAYGAAMARRRREETQAHNEKLAHAASHDPLTGLPNRSFFTDLVENSLQDAIAGDGNCALLMIDLDRFKWVNDTLGHNAGDVLLCKVSAILRDAVGDKGHAARLGGDEFAIILPTIVSEAKVSLLASEIVERLSQPFDIDGDQASIGATIGIAVGPNDGDTLTRLVRSADLALYEGKDHGRNQAVRFEPTMLEAVEEQRMLHEDLARALERGELKLAYQAISRINDGQIVGYEALVRWEHTTLGIISPARFIPIAEETGLIRTIGDWVLRTACARAVQWPHHYRVAVNLSAIQINSGGIANQVMNALAFSGLAPDQLELEVTESAFLGYGSDAGQTLAQLRAMGVRLALDDFGTGYSSLGYLKRAEFSNIKIDRSFVTAASEGSAESQAIIRAIVALARDLGMATTAEGIETAREFECMRTLGCTQAQGYLIARPESAPVISGASEAA